MAHPRDNALVLVRVLGLLFVVLGITSGAFTVVMVLLELARGGPLPEAWWALAYYGVIGLVACPAYVTAGAVLLWRSAWIANRIAPRFSPE